MREIWQVYRCRMLSLGLLVVTHDALTCPGARTITVG